MSEKLSSNGFSNILTQFVIYKWYSLSGGVC